MQHHAESIISVLLLGAVLGVASACDRPEGTPASVVRDSAGITVVESAGVGSGERAQWSISDVPVWTARASGGSESRIYDVVGALRLPNQEVVVANAGTNELLFFGPDGEFVRSIGGAGSGPGEFRALRGLHRFRGDSLAVGDLGTRRVSVFDAEGRFARTFPIPQVDDGVILDLAGALDRGSLPYVTLPVMGAAEPKQGTTRLPVSVYETDAEGQHIRKLGTFPGFDVYTSMAGGMPMAGLLPLGRRTQLAVGGNGFYVGVPDAYEVARYDRDGELATIIRSRHRPVPVTTEHKDLLRERMFEGVPAGPLREAIAERVDAAPAYFPPYDQFVVDSEGNLWVRRYALPDESDQRWDVFDSSGKYTASLDLPARLTIHDIGSDHVVVVRKDELDEEHLEVYRLSR